MSSASVKINDSSKAFLTILAKKSSKSQQDYLSTAIDYIYETGLNIYNKKSVNVGDSMKALENRLIGFMKKREKDFFVPMSHKMTALTKSNIDLLQGLETLDIINFAREKTEDKIKPDFIVPVVENKPNVEPVLQKSSILSQEKASNIDLEKHKERAELYKGELEFLMSKINKGSGLNTGKFVANITQRDNDRINRILSDN